MNVRLGVAVLVVNDAGELLLGRRGKEPNYGKWIVPGGGVEPGESWHATARREIREETGLHVHVASTHPYVLEIINPGEHRVILCAGGSLDPMPGLLVPSSDLLEAKFFAPGHLPDDISPAVRPVLVEYGWLPR
jgi:8-oxo-dGTP diphosphatase